jgi:hypothetical protein
MSARRKTPRAAAEKTPTMIIPKGSDIQVDVHGQLNITTPGNLVIENSGHYGIIESVNGSIRIESNADVEAVSVQCPSVCYVKGSLTAWRVAAESIQLEDRAQANIVLQESARLEVGKEARMIGNYASEKELFLTFSRFAEQLRSLPLFSERQQSHRQVEGDGGSREALPSPREIEVNPGEASAGRSVPVPPSMGGKADGELPDPLFFALVLLEREFSRSAYGPTSQRVIEQLIKLLHERDLETLGLTYKTLCARVVEPGTDVQRAS